jgi:predicted KAP-like P-loop ATPase
VIVSLTKAATVTLPGLQISGKDAIETVEEQDKLPGMPTLYSDELASVEDALKQINDERKSKDQRDLKFVFFIDDLDRCAPDRVVEVLESIKVLLGVKGFIYVLGLNPEVVEKCIAQKYKESRISGQDYIKKIVQIPFMIPEWREDDINKYLAHVIAELDSEYQSIFNKHGQLLSKGVERNPREIKRFINNYMVIHQVFGLDAGILMLLQILRFRWPALHDIVFDERALFRKILTDSGVHFSDLEK